uniref:Uncharacterized protein n=1 Tax=Arundo donax TaxID=35708 RepID=A0A0A9DPJ5_ARUDO
MKQLCLMTFLFFGDPRSLVYHFQNLVIMHKLPHISIVVFLLEKKHFVKQGGRLLLYHLSRD